MIQNAPMLTVYTMEDSNLSILGVIQNYTSIQYTPIFDDVGSFVLKLPFSKKMFELVMPSDTLEKVILIEDGIVGICQKISCEFSSKSEVLKIQGQLGEAFLDNAIIGDYDYKLSNSTDENPYTIQDHIQNSLNTTTVRGSLWEAIDFKTITVDETFIPNNDVVAGKSTFGEFVRTLCKSCNKGYKLRLNLQTNKLDFSLSDYTNRGLTSDEPIFISRETMSLGDSKFSVNSQSYKNRLMAWTEFDLNNQTYTALMQIDYDEASKQPHSKKEIRADYVKLDITSEETISSVAEAYSRLNSVGKQALYDASYIKSYDSEVKSEQNSIFKFNRDYFLGDIVVVRDSKIGLDVDVKLLEYTKTIDLTGSHFDPTFGVSQPTLNTVLRKQKIIR